MHCRSFTFALFISPSTAPAWCPPQAGVPSELYALASLIPAPAQVALCSGLPGRTFAPESREQKPKSDVAPHLFYGTAQ